MSNPLDQMIDALSLEVAAIRKKGSSTQLELRGGERLGQADETWLYQFVVAEELNLRDDTPVRVSAGQEDVSGILVSFRDGVLLVALEKDLGPRISLARLVANDAFLVERLRDRLEKIRKGEAEFNRPAAERALGLAASRSEDAEPNALAIEGANPDQTRAVRRSLGSDMLYVWGPPGTGKTHTLARIVEAHYRAGRSVLLVSNTNIAVDTALQSVAERLKGETDFHQGLAIRQGPVVKNELRQRFGPQVVLDEIVARMGAALRREKDRLKQAVAPIEAEEKLLRMALEGIERLAQIRYGLAALEKSRDIAVSTAAARENEVGQNQARVSSLRADLARAQTMGAVRRLFSGLDPQRLQRDVAAAERAANAAAEAARMLRGDIVRAESEITRMRSEIERLSAQTKQYPPAQNIKAGLDKLRADLTRLREKIAAADRELASIEQSVLARCRILATTVYRTYLAKSALRSFDAVVIDEASMLMPPLVYYVAGLAKQSVTVAGDFRQLPPIVISDEPLAEDWLKRDVFEKAGIPRRVERSEPTPQLVALGVQYRMREPICSVVNDLFYPDHPLHSDPGVRHGGDGFPLSDSPLLYVDTSAFHPWTALRVGTFSRYNLLHALLVRNIVLHLAETGFLPPEGEPNDAVGAVAPYSSQARLIQALLDDRLGARAAGIAATVHRFQGNEKSAMILDLTDSLGARLGRFLKATRIDEEGARLLNVAASRAKHHIVLVGNFNYVRAKAPGDGFVRRLVERFEKDGEALEIKSLLPLAERDWVDGLHRVLPSGFELPEGAAGAFTEGTFYPAFVKDLARARESVVIFSPFATNSGTGRWVDAIRAALARGVRFRILTRPAEEWGGGGANEVNEIVHSLRKIGAAVDLRARMHEKIAIVDGHILWHGSLNILSHRDTHESMLRIDSPAACRQVGRFVTTPGRRDQDLPTLHVAENPDCPLCGNTTVWNSGRFGVYFECEEPTCAGKVDPRSRARGQQPDSARQRAASGRRMTKITDLNGSASQTCPRPGCGGRLSLRNGRHGRFLGCTNYPTCRHTENAPYRGVLSDQVKRP